MEPAALIGLVSDPFARRFAALALADGDRRRAALPERRIVNYVASVVTEDDPLAAHAYLKHGEEWYAAFRPHRVKSICAGRVERNRLLYYIVKTSCRPYNL